MSNKRYKSTSPPTSRRSVSRRGLLKLMGAGAGASLLAACAVPTPSGTNGAQSSQTGGEQPAEDQEIALSYLAWPMFPDHKAVVEEVLVAPFVADYPGTSVDVSIQAGFAEYNQRLNTLFAADTPPDVFAVSVAVIWDFANLGIVANIQDLIDRDLNTEDYYMNIAQPDRYPQPDGPLHAFPFNWVCSVLYYNKDMFDQAGVSYPDESWTYDTLLEAAQQLTNADQGFWGFDSSPAHTFLDALIMSYGGKVLSDDYTTCLLTEPTALERIQWAVDLIGEHNVAPNARVAKEAGLSAAGSAFASGRVGMSIDGSWAISNQIVGTDFNWDIAMVPTGPERRVIYGGPDQVALAKQSPYQDMAWEWAKRLVGPDRPLESFSEGAVPFYRPKAESDAWKNRVSQNLQAILDSAPYIVGAEFGHNWSQWRIDAMNGILGTAFIGEKSVEEAAAEACTEIDRILTEPF